MSLDAEQHHSNIFGVAADPDGALFWLLPVPWHVTTSYGRGTARGPNSILLASPQVDLEDNDFGATYKRGLYWQPTDRKIADLNEEMSAIAERIIDSMDTSGSLNAELTKEQHRVNEASAQLTEFVYSQSKNAIDKNKIPAVIGGDHSSPLGLIKAVGEKYNGDFGILHIDAHADLREAYQGFNESHASIMNNVLKLDKGPSTLVQIGIRDYCHEELEKIEQDNRITCFFDRDIKRQGFSGFNWNFICDEVLKSLPENIYISFDIDGLSPEFCPGTGTPVPGGLSFDEAIHLLVRISESGRKLVGFDLCEVAPSPNSEWDANVGARILYKLCGL